MNSFAVCTNNLGAEVSLDIRKIYKVLKDEKAEKVGMVRIIDNSGEDYLHSLHRFVIIQLDIEIEQKIFSDEQ